MKLRRLARSIAAAVVVSAAFGSAQAAPILYASGSGTGPNGGLSAIYEVDPSTGASTLVFGFPTIHIYNGGLAYDASTDTLYATGVEDSSTGTSRLFAIDRATGAFTSFPGMSSTINLSQGGLAIHPLTGVLYATGGNGFQSSGLFTIDKATGAATLIGQTGGQCCVNPYGFNLNGIGFRSDGTLFANGFTLTDGISSLFTIDLATGAATAIGAHGVSSGRALRYSGLAFRADGVLLSLGDIDGSNDGLFAIDPATGAATLLGGTGPRYGVDGGLSFAVPEPGALLLLGAAFVAGVARRALKTPRS